MPGIVKGLDLRLALMPVRRLEQQIVIGVGIERRIEIDEIDALVFDVLAQNGKIVAIRACCGRVASDKTDCGFARALVLRDGRFAASSG